MNDDVERIEEQYHRLKDDVRRMAVYFLGSRDFCDDIVQDVFLELTKSAGKFRGASSFRTYVFAVTRNVSRRYIRNLVARRRVADEVPDKPAMPAKDDTLIDQMALNAALGKLKSKHREPLLLKETEGLSYQEISEILRINVGTVKFRISYAKKQLLGLLRR